MKFESVVTERAALAAMAGLVVYLYGGAVCSALALFF